MLSNYLKSFSIISQLHLRSLIHQFLLKEVLPFLGNQSGTQLLEQLSVAWSNHQLYVKWMSRFFMYLDRYYVKLQAVPTLGCKGFSIFQSKVLNAELSEETRKALLGVVRKEREAEAGRGGGPEASSVGKGEGELAKKVVSIFIELGQVGRINI